jgi:hypothetical protein
MAFMPRDHTVQEIPGIGFVADEVVIADEYLAAPPQAVEGLHFGQHLLRGLMPRLATEESHYVAKFAIERTAPGGLEDQHSIILKAEEIKAGSGGGG